MWAHNAVCDAAEVAHIEKEVTKDANNIGVGVIDTTTGEIRLFTFDETSAFSMANSNLQAAAGHEAAAVMAGFQLANARGFALGKQGNDWHIFNLSHLNQADSQTNSMNMARRVFDAIVAALGAAGIRNPVIH